jgi:Lon protease-like protein
MTHRNTNDDKELPDNLPVFPLSGVLLLPRGHLPLNIFEPRYLAMVDYALKHDRLIGMIQPNPALGCGNNCSATSSPILSEYGCAGRITAFEETSDGRYLISLTGVSRFKIETELDGHNGFRRVKADWSPFACDLKPAGCLNLHRPGLCNLLAQFFDQHGITVDWEAVDVAGDEKLITALAMICPFTAGEKQALLEAADCKARADLFVTLLEMAVRGHEDDKTLQ